MERQYSGVRYTQATTVPAEAWMIQGTTYETPEQAKFAAVKLWATTQHSGVLVKRLENGTYTCFFWRYIANV